MTNAGAVARSIVRDAARLDRSGLELRFALRCTAGMALPLIVAASAGAPLAGVSAAYGALVTGFASRQGVYRTRAAGMVLTALALAAAGIAGTSTAAQPALNIACAAAVAAGFGLAAALGPSANTASINGVVAFVLFSNAPYAAANPWLQAGAVVAGSLVQTLLLVAVWPLRRFRAERDALAAALRDLARYAATVDSGDLGVPGAAPLAVVRRTLADPQPFGGRNELAAFVLLADELERARSTLAALTNDYHVQADVGRADAARALARFAGEAAAVLGLIADGVDRGVEPAVDDGRWSALDAGVRAVESAVVAGSPAAGDARVLATTLRAIRRAARWASNGGIATVDATPLPHVEVASIRDAWTSLRANLAPESVYARHALRHAVTIAVAIGVQRLLPLEHGQWIALTVALVLRPDFGSTFTRGLGRIFGTIAGAIAASAIASLHPGAGAYLVLAIGCAAAAFALFNVSYAVFSAAITGYVVFLLAFGGLPEPAAALDRVVATFVGGALAAIAYIAWPTWAHARVADDVAALLDAHAAYGSAVLRAFAGGGAAADGRLREAQLRARRARSNAEASVELMTAEPVRGHGLSLAGAQAILAISRRVAIVLLSLGARIDPRDTVERPRLEALIADFDAALAGLARALRGGAAVDVSRVRDDQARLARDPDVYGDMLVAETAALAQSIDAIAEIVREDSSE